MWHIGIDLHRRDLVMAAVDDSGHLRDPVRIRCSDVEEIQRQFKMLKPFRAVVEATDTYYWLYELLHPLGTVLLAHTMKLRAMINRRSKTDRLDAMLLAQLLRIDQIPLAYIPPKKYQNLRYTMRYRAKLAQNAARLKTGLKSLAARHNVTLPYENCFGPRGRKWFRKTDFGSVDNMVRDDLLDRIALIDKQILGIESCYDDLQERFPEVKALLDIHGMGVYTALLIVGELGEVDRFRTAKQVGAYAGLTPRVSQSGDHCYHGHITRQGSSWLRWALVEVAMKVTAKDKKLRLFYQRIRKRSSRNKARVAVARKLAEICWKRIKSFQQAKVS